MVNLLGFLSTLTSSVGIVFFFINPVVTLFCAVFSLLNSWIQVVFAEQNNLNTEVFTVIIACLVALIFNLNYLNTIAFAICIGDAVLSIVGWIAMFFTYKKFYK